MIKIEECRVGTLHRVSFVSPIMVGCAVVQISRGFETMIGDLEQGDFVVLMSNSVRRTDDFEEVFVLSKVGLGWFPICYIAAS